MAFVDQIANRLPDEVIGDGIGCEAVVMEELPFLLDILPGGSGGIDVEVIAPAGKFEAVVAHALGEWREFFEGKVGPLAGEESDRSWHGR